MYLSTALRQRNVKVVHCTVHTYGCMYVLPTIQWRYTPEKKWALDSVTRNMAPWLFIILSSTRRPRHPGHTKALFACLHVILINILTPLFIIVYLSVCLSVAVSVFETLWQRENFAIIWYTLALFFFVHVTLMHCIMVNMKGCSYNIVSNEGYLFKRGSDLYQ